MICNTHCDFCGINITGEFNENILHLDKSKRAKRACEKCFNKRYQLEMAKNWRKVK